MKHDVDYSVKSFTDIDLLNKELDNLRLGGLAPLEELHQLLTKNKALAESKGWKVDTILSQLETAIKIVRDI